jgi:hypothetical protein
MNERIEKLAIECYQAPEFDYKKFAELIVRECIDYCFFYGDDIEYIKNHFGVK